MIQTVRKSLGPWGYGLVGYDAEDKLVIVIPVNPKNGPRWMHRNVTAADRRRVKAAAEE